MAQINLLKQKSASPDYASIVPSLLVKLFLVLLIALLGYYAWLYFKVKSTDKSIVVLKQEIQQSKASVEQKKERRELITRQGQLKELDSVLAAHTYWSSLLPALAKVTLTTASYSSIRVTTDGNLILAVSLPGLEDLDKFLQVFDQPKVYENFSDVRIGAFNKVPEGDTTTVKFDVKMKFNPQLMQYAGKETGAR